MGDEEPRAPVEEHEEGAPEWMVTYGDLMTLLLCFFVLLLAFSRMDDAMFKEVAGSLEEAFGVQRQTPEYSLPKGVKMIARDFDQSVVQQATVKVGEDTRADELEHIAELLQERLKPLQEQGLVEFEIQEDYLVMRLLGQATFDSGKAALKSDVVPILRDVGQLLGQAERDVIVAGHTDDVPISGGIYKSNLELSAARAASVVDFFLTEHLVQPPRIATMAFGEYRPLAPNDSEANRQKNRRVEILLSAARTVSSDSTSAPLPFSLLSSPQPPTTP